MVANDNAAERSVVYASVRPRVSRQSEQGTESVAMFSPHLMIPVIRSITSVATPPPSFSDFSALSSVSGAVFGEFFGVVPWPLSG